MKRPNLQSGYVSINFSSANRAEHRPLEQVLVRRDTHLPQHPGHDDHRLHCPKPWKNFYSEYIIHNLYPYMQRPIRPILYGPYFIADKLTSLKIAISFFWIFAWTVLRHAISITSLYSWSTCFWTTSPWPPWALLSCHCQTVPQYYDHCNNFSHCF